MIDPETGTECHQLTSDADRWNIHVYTDVSPWKPGDPNQIVYASGFWNWNEPAEIVLLGIDGSVAWPLASDGKFSRYVGCFQCWAPDGSGIYYFSRGGANPPGTTFIDLKTMERRYVGPYFRSLSPDGNHLSYREIGQDRANKHFGGNDLCFMETDGTGHRVFVTFDTLQELSSDPATLPYGHFPLTFINHIFSPDGKKLLFSNSWGERFCAISDCIGGDSLEFFRLGGAGHRDWYPDSERIVYMGQEAIDGSYGVCSIRWDGTDRRVICDDTHGYGSHGSHPCVSPDGRWIISESYVPGDYSLYLIDEETGIGRKFLNTPTLEQEKPYGVHQHPVWSADSKRIIYNTDISGTGQLYIAEVPGN